MNVCFAITGLLIHTLEVLRIVCEAVQTWCCEGDLPEQKCPGSVSQLCLALLRNDPLHLQLLLSAEMLLCMCSVSSSAFIVLLGFFSYFSSMCFIWKAFIEVHIAAHNFLLFLTLSALLLNSKLYRSSFYAAPSRTQVLFQRWIFQLFILVRSCLKQTKV